MMFLSFLVEIFCFKEIGGSGAKKMQPLASAIASGCIGTCKRVHWHLQAAAFFINDLKSSVQYPSFQIRVEL